MGCTAGFSTEPPASPRPAINQRFGCLPWRAYVRPPRFLEHTRERCLHAGLGLRSGSVQPGLRRAGSPWKCLSHRGTWGAQAECVCTSGGCHGALPTQDTNRWRWGVGAPGCFVRCLYSAASLVITRTPVTSTRSRLTLLHARLARGRAKKGGRGSRPRLGSLPWGGWAWPLVLLCASTPSLGARREL